MDKSASFIRKMGSGLTALGALAIAVGGTWILNNLAQSASDHDVQLSGIGVLVIENRSWLWLLTLPTFFLALAPLFIQRGQLIANVLAAVLLLPPIAMVILGVITVLAPLYQYQPL